LSNPDGTSGNNLSGVLSQTFRIPDNAVEAALDYWHRTTTTEIGGAIDRLNVRLRLSNGSLHGIDDIWNTDFNSAYTHRSIDLTSYAGQTVTLEFSGTTSAGAPTTFRIDDVSLIVTVPTPPMPVSLVIAGPSSIAEGGTGQYYATMIYSDGSTNIVSALTWGNNMPSLVAFTSGGLLTSDQVNQDTVVSIYTSAQVGGQTYQAFKDVRIVDQPTFTSLAINGPTSMNENSSRQFTATANFSDGSARPVSANWLLSSGPGAVSNAGLLSVGDLTGDALTTLSASYTVAGVTRSATQQILIINTSIPPTFVSLSISGPNSVIENGTAQFTGVAIFSDASSQLVNPTWTLTSTAASISGFGLFSAGEVTADVLVNLSGSYTAGGITRSASRDVTVVNDIAVPTGPYEAKWALAMNTFNVSASTIAQDGAILLVGDFAGTLTAGGQLLTASGSEEDIFAVKMDASGQVVWVRQYGGSNEDQVDSCAPHPSGGWVISGNFKGTTTFGSQTLTVAGTGTKSDAFLIRLDDSGNVLWARRGGGTDVDYGRHAVVDGSGNCFLIGHFTTSATFTGGSTTLTAVGARFDIFLAKYSSAGDFQWAKSAGGPAYDTVGSAVADAAGNIYVGGTFETQAAFGPYTLTVQGNPVSYDAYVAKWSGNGDVLWATRFGEQAGEQSDDSINFLSIGPDGSCFFGGQYDGPMVADGYSLPNHDNIFAAFVGKMDSVGTLQWLTAAPATSTPGALAIMSDSQRGVATPDGGLMIGGRYRGRLGLGEMAITNNTLNEYL
jgi:hypothetical protein